MINKNYLWIFIIFVFTIILFLLFNSANWKSMNEINKILTTITNSDHKKVETTINKNVIFDLGANIGDSALFFADPEFKCDNCH